MQSPQIFLNQKGLITILLDIKSMNIKELTTLLTSLNQPSFRGKQLFSWLHIQKVTSFDEMSNLPKSLITMLKQQCQITTLKIKQKLVSSIDGTIKYLYELNDKECIETVLMRYNHGNSICISSQVGCKMGCTFCASTKAKFVRNLTSSEMLEQIYETARDIGDRVSNVVLMGIGEPLDNYDNVVRFLELLSDPLGHGLSLRHVSLSTCGVVDKIYALAKLNLSLTLSISLHAATDSIRLTTMPITNKWSIAELITACKHYLAVTGRRISFEYALIKGVNDTKQDALNLAALLKGMLAHVNLIPVNEIEETSFKKSTVQNTLIFQQYLEDKGINATIRRTLGTDINAACGQLRSQNSEIKKGDLF